MKRFIVFVHFMCLLMVIMAQRAPFAGKRPNGYKDRLQTDTNNDGIVDRFSENTEKLPNLALGDREVVDLLNTYPVDQRPFWLINTDAIEAQKNQGRPTTNVNQNTVDLANRFGTGTVNTNYPSVVYPMEMTSSERQQAQQLFNNQIQQIIENKQPIQSNTMSSQFSSQQSVITQQPVITQRPLNNGPQRIPLNSGYRG